MKYIKYLPGIICAFCLMIVFLITSVEAVCYWTPGYYENEYAKYQVLDDLPPMTMEDLLDVTDQMMAFLRGKRDHLHVFTTMGGEEREFFNAREIAHMEDVRKLFLAGLMVRRICLIAALSCALLLWFWRRREFGRLLAKSMCIGTGLFFLAALAVAGIISTNFSKYFVVFHEIFFDNDLWILDPRTDMLINIVPEPFFMDTALRIGLTFAGITAVFFAACLFIAARRGTSSVS